MQPRADDRLKTLTSPKGCPTVDDWYRLFSRECAVRLLRGTRTLPPSAGRIVGHRLIGARSCQHRRSVMRWAFLSFPLAVNVPVTMKGSCQAGLVLAIPEPQVSSDRESADNERLRGGDVFRHPTRGAAPR